MPRFANVALLLSSLWISIHAVAQQAPNIVVILADDLGYSDLGCYGGEIQTPHLDALAEDGLRWTQFYNTARCWPTRASLLTGYYAQQVRRDKLPGLDAPTGGGGKRPDWAPLLPESLDDAGYRSYHAGKWHVDGMPLGQGFDASYYLRDQGRFFNPKTHYLNDKPLPPVEKGSDFYGTREIASRAIQQLRNHERDTPESPFFLYLAFTAPHFPLHALPEDIAVYDGVYDVGWEVIRQRRWERQKELGIPFLTTSTPGDPDSPDDASSGNLGDRLRVPSEPERDLGPPYDFPQHIEQLGPGEVNRPVPWDTLSAEQQRFQADKMELHAAMVHRMDIEIGRTLAQIRSMGVWDNTLIVFLSDNGASAEIMVRDDGHDLEAPMGAASTYLCLGPGWSTVANTPFRRHKTWTHEGGIRTPFILHWPERVRGPDRWETGPCHVIDLAPTFLKVAGAESDRPGAPPLPGIPLPLALAGDAGVHQRTLWWLHDGHRAVRYGSWKAVAPEDRPWELYHLSVDPTESRDLADRDPSRLQAMVDRWREMTDSFISDLDGVP